jgi:hypothetical protein
MTDDLTEAVLATWAARHLPARLDVLATAKLLGFSVSDIHVLMTLDKLTPLGDPAPNAPKWFCAVEVIRLATDKEWLHKATREISKHWRHKRAHNQFSPPLLAVTHAQAV